MVESIEWVEKYRPQSLKDIVGNKKSVVDMREWAQSWLSETPEKRAVILHGPAGVGKTSAAHALARDLDWEIIELNASDQRTAGVIERVAGSASKMSSLTGTTAKRLIILDEADNIHGNADRGGARAIGGIIKNTDHPIVLIANDLYGLTPSVRSLCIELKFNSVQGRSMIPALKRICVEEKIMCGVGVLEKLAENAGGDLRSAIKDLQAVATGRDEIHIEDIATSERDTKESIFKVLGKIFKNTDPKTALEATYGLDETPENLIHWIDENLPLQYGTEEGTEEDLITGYEHLAKADRYLGRVRKRQSYRLWRYAGALMTCGTVVSKAHVGSGFTKYQPPSFWRKMGQLRAKRDMRDNIASKIADHANKSMRYSRTDLAHLYGRMLEEDEYAADVTFDLELSIDEMVYLTGKKKVTKDIQRIHDLAQARRQSLGRDEGKAFFEKKPRKQTPDKKQMDLTQIINSAPQENKVEKKETENVPPVKKSASKAKPQKTLFDF
ncbi:replication factor C large subunit [Methanococcoides alaskense]|uniref:Replication factor C large subunit n=1 Tax=Methanococcoides alaskense TaxID=325778 RepID=A0AA90U100_9EURY|nr:replication factor C large subunit [Methanococcoides alaskense]MDA0524149.1 replication factor C large subunit [Methanococcoides alaskense]MDR6223860.1 replication factor C large subunit [Methanococcoides alaskense]